MSTSILAGVILLAAGTDGQVAAERTAQLVGELVIVLRNEVPGCSIWSRLEAAETIGKLGPDAYTAVPGLAMMLDNPYRHDPEFIDEAVIRALGKIGNAARPAIPALVRISGKDPDIERAATAAINRILLSPPIGPGDVPTLMRELRDPEPSTRVRAAKALGGLGPAGKPAIPLLVEALKDPDSDVRLLALKALRRIDPKAGSGEGEANLYMEQLRDADPGIRLQAAKALGRMGPAAAAAAQSLLETTTDSDPDVRRQATDALNRIQPPQ